MPNKPRSNGHDKGTSASTKRSNRLQSFSTPGMYTSLAIQGFRSFEHVELEDLARINLFFGANNSGKTTVLEAIFTHACGLNFTPFEGQVVGKRSDHLLRGPLDLGEKLISIFNDISSPPYKFSIAAKTSDSQSSNTLVAEFHPAVVLADLEPKKFGQFSGVIPSGSEIDSQNTVSQIQIAGQQLRVQGTTIRTTFIGKWETSLNGAKNNIDVRFPLTESTTISPFKLANMHDILSHRQPEADTRVFSALKRYGMLKEFIQEMQHTFPEIIDIDMIPYPDGTLGAVYLVTANEDRIPLYAAGDGTRRWFHLLGHMLVNKNACHCIEEIDSTFHPTAQEGLSRLLVKYAKQFDNQLFITSHSIEFTDTFLEALYGDQGFLREEAEDPVRLYTIKRSTMYDVPEVWVLTGRDAYQKRKDYALELR